MRDRNSSDANVVLAIRVCP